MKNMEKLEEIHYKNGVNDLEYAPCAAEITTDIAIKFAEWLAEEKYKYRFLNYWEKNDFSKSPYTTKELFKEFINNHYGK